MSRLAMDQITITDVTDGEKGVSVKIVTPFYALGTTAPDKPTTNTPESVWTTTEPEYVKGNNLYTTQRTVLEDSTFLYSDVSLDSSYKASEQAIATADMANTTAGEAKTTAGEAKTTAGEAKTTAGEAKTASTTNKNNLESEITARNQAIEDLKTSVGNDVDAVSQKAADAQQAADDAATDLSTFRTSTESRLTSIDGLVSGVRTDVDAVSNKADTLASGIDSANTNITSTSDKLTGLTTTVSNVSKTADDAMALSTTNHQDLAGFKTTVQQTYNTKEDTLSQVSAVSQKADAISATLSKDYQKTADSDAKYSTKAELTATSNSITASMSETYATKSVVDALKNIADNAIETWQGHGIPSMAGKPASDWTTDVLKKQHSGDMYYDLDSGYSYRFGSADGSTYAWSKIADSDITKAMQAAADAQSAADKANDGVTKLNTDIPVTYATKSDVKITTDGIKADVVEAKRIGQTGVDNAAALAIRADGIDATLSQQATNIDKNVKSITQLGLRADGISTSVSQVDAKADQALTNAQELVVNGGFETGDLTGWSGSYWSIDSSTSRSGSYSLTTTSNKELVNTTEITAVTGRTLRFSFYAKSDGATAGFFKRMLGWNGRSWVVVVNGNKFDALSSDWTLQSFDYTCDGTYPKLRFRTIPYNDDSNTLWVDDVSVKDITESAAAQKDATTALSQYSTLSQDLSGFKTQVTQTYETKDSSTAKATTAQQNLDGFKNTVSSTYATKTALDTTNGNVTKAQATGDQAIFAALPSLADNTQANSWLCAIFPTGNGSVQTLPSYSLIAPLAASYTSYQADGTGTILDKSIDYSYGLIRTLVSFSADTTWTFTYTHDDGSRIYVDGIKVFESAKYVTDDLVTISFTKGNHIVDVMYSNATGGAGIWAFSVSLSSIATTMYAPAGASVLATSLDKAQKDATSALSQYSTLSQDVSGFKQTVSQTYATKMDMDALDSLASLTFDFLSANGHKYYWYKLGTLTQNTQGKMTKLEVILSAGNNGGPDQNKTATIYVQKGWTGGAAKDMFGLSVLNHNWADVQVLGLMSSKGSDLDLWVSVPNQSTYTCGNYVLSGFRQKWVDGRTYSETDPTGELTAQNVKYYESPEQAKQALANTVASTYTTKSEFTQTTDKIQSSVTASLNRMGGNMLINGGFETGDMTGWGPIDVAKTDLAGAQHSGKNRLWFQYLTQNSSKIRSNNYLSFINGHKYRLSFWVSMMDSVTFNACIWSTTKGGMKAEVTPVGSSGGKYVQITNEFDWTIEDVHDGYVVLEFPILTTADTQNGVRLDDFELTDITDYSELSSLVTQTSEQWGVQLNQVATASTDAITDVKTTISNQSDALGTVSAKVDDEITQRQAYMQFTQDEKGKPTLELGASENTNKVKLSNDRLSFMSENSEVAYISNKELHINNATIVQSLIIGNIGFIPRADGHLTLTRI